MSTPAKTARPAGARAPPRRSFYRPDNYRPEESVGYLMRRILNSASQEVERELEPSGLTNAQWVPLLKLYMGSASTVAELARECQLDAGGMTRLLDRLEAKGLLRRVRSSDDRRVVNLELTEPGRGRGQAHSGRAVRRAERPHARLHGGRVEAAAHAAGPHPGQRTGDPGRT